MPIKRRAGKSRQFDEHRACQLLAGPDALLLAGVGYLTATRFDQMTEADQAAALADMRADWERHGADLLAWWNGDDDAFRFKPWNFIIRDPARRPWAAEQFREVSSGGGSDD
ncbi:MAG: hypothetical protein ACR2JJ_05040 [Sphingomicrobium sp.]